MNFEHFHFIRPLWLIALLPALGLCFFIIQHKRDSGSWEKICDSALLPYLLQHKNSQQSRIPITTATLTACLLILAMAGPTWERIPAPVFRNDSALVIALNLSESMNAADISPSRLIRARYKISDILKQRKDGQTALLVYSGNAFTVTPLTNDSETIDSQLSALTTDIMPNQGNNAGLAIGKATELLKQAGLPKGQILLITDSADINNTLPIAKELRDFSLSILAVGTTEGGPIKASGGDFIKDEQGNIIIPKMNATELKQIASAGHGLFLTLRDDNKDVDALINQVNKALEDTDSTNKLMLEQWSDQGPWLILLALPLAALSFRKGLLSLALITLLPFPKTSHALEWKDLWLTKDQQAQHAFQNKDYDKAAEQFTDPAWKASAHYKAGKYTESATELKNAQTADNYYNQGNALAQNGQLAEAIKAYEHALALKPDDADTVYNKDLVEKELKKQQEQQQKEKQQQPQNQEESDKNQKDQQSSDQKKQSDPSQNQDKNQQDSGDKSEQAPEPKDDKNTKQDPASAQENQKSQEEKAKEEQAKQQAEQQAQKTAEAQKSENEKASQPAAEKSIPLDETKQANEQWLKRIPDDPAGLLRRKFKYQYGQLKQQNTEDSQ